MISITHNCSTNACLERASDLSVLFPRTSKGIPTNDGFIKSSCSSLLCLQHQQHTCHEISVRGNLNEFGNAQQKQKHDNNIKRKSIYDDTYYRVWQTRKHQPSHVLQQSINTVFNTGSLLQFALSKKQRMIRNIISFSAELEKLKSGATYTRDMKHCINSHQS